MRYSKRLIGIALLSIMSPICAQAAIVTIGIEATIDEVIDESNLLDGVVKAGDIITGSYKYDSEVLDTEPDFQNVGVYHQYAPDYSISLNVNDMNISSNINDGYYRISVVNNSADKGGDAYSIVSINNMDLNNGLGIEIISWQLDDPTGTAISSQHPLRPHSLSSRILEICQTAWTHIKTVCQRSRPDSRSVLDRVILSTRRGSSQLFDLSEL